MKTIVIYYTYTGHTKYIAEMIKKRLNCDILKISPEKEYSKDYDSVVNEYQNNESTKETPILNKIDIDLSEYDKFIIGTPVWWYTIAPPIRTFLKENNLKSKTIIPFATNAGWLGRTFKEIESLCTDSKIEKEMNIVFSEDYTRNDLVTNIKEIEKWIDNI